MTPRPAARRAAAVVATFAMTFTVTCAGPSAAGRSEAASTSSAVPASAMPMIGTTVRETGVIRGIADGDTFYLNRQTPAQRIRLSGLQTTEIAHSGVGRNWCHGLEAKRRLTTLTLNKKVVLRSLFAASYATDGRRLRYAYVWTGRNYADVQLVLLREGHALWHPSAQEWINNLNYHAYADLAALYRRPGSIWDDDWCGYGPYQGAPLRVWVNWDAEGDDNANINGEYVVVANDGGYPVSLSRWYLRLNSHLTYTFPYGTYLPAGGRIKLHAGHGYNTSTDYYWGSSNTLFANANASNGMGAGAYLLDPQGDFRAWFTYPCVIYCHDPLQGRLAISAVNHRAHPENIRLTLAQGGGRVSLDDLIMKVRSRNHRFPAGSYLDPGETLTVSVGTDPGGQADRLHQFWDQPSGILNDWGDKVVVETYRSVRVACSAYGTERCP